MNMDDINFPNSSDSLCDISYLLKHTEETNFLTASITDFSPAFKAVATTTLYASGLWGMYVLHNRKNSSSSMVLSLELKFSIWTNFTPDKSSTNTPPKLHVSDANVTGIW